MNDLKKFYTWNTDFDGVYELIEKKDGDFVDGNNFKTIEDAERWLNEIDTYEMKFREGDLFVLIANYEITPPSDNSFIIKNRAQRAQEKLRLAEDDLKEIQKDCRHTNTFEGNWEWRVGSTIPATICSDCGTCIKMHTGIL